MNFSNLLSNIGNVDPEVYQQSKERRSVIKGWMRGLALATVPLAISSLANKANAKNTADPILDALNILLKLKYLESEFYDKALTASVGPPASANPLIPSGLEQRAFIEILGQERKHTLVLHDNIRRYSPIGVAVKPNFDFTAGGGFPNVFSQYDVFLAVAQSLEDLGVRAFKTVFPFLIGKNELFSAVLRIHSSEARHSAHIRAMRRDTPSPLNAGIIKPWITGNLSNINALSVQQAYDDEDNTLQASIQITNINGLAINSDSATESFDEPISLAVVDAILTTFIIP